MSKTSPNRPARIPGGAFVLPLCAEPIKNCRSGKEAAGAAAAGFFARLLPGLWPAAPGDGRRAAVRRDAGLMVGGGFCHRRRADCQPEISAKDAFHGRQVSSE
jgi:hypothetical protein